MMQIQTKIPTVGLVVTFVPTAGQLANIRLMARNLDHLCVVDNTEAGQVEFENLPGNVKVLSNRNLGGIAGALNLGIQNVVAQFENCYVFLLDQDSVLPPSFFDAQVRFADENGRVAVAPKYFDVNSRTFGNYTRLSKWSLQNISGESANSPFESTFAISSGTLIHSSVFSKVGLFREDYFIDHVDSEFCIRMQTHGIRILINPNVTFEHSIGTRKKKRFLGITFKPNFHSPTRRYYAIRNGIFLVRDYVRSTPSIALLIAMRIGYEYAGIVLFENAKLPKLKSLVLGVFDGITDRRGKCSRCF